MEQFAYLVPIRMKAQSLGNLDELIALRLGIPRRFGVCTSSTKCDIERANCAIKHRLQGSIDHGW